MKKLLTICLMLLGAVAQAQNFAITATTEAAIRKNIVKGNAANYGFGMINDTLKLVGLTTRNVIFTGSTSKTDIGLGNVDNTSDLNKPVSTATQTALNLKQNQLNGTGFVKATGTTISYDNSTYLSTSTAVSTYLPISNPTSTGTLTAPTIANSLGANFATSSGNVGIGTTTPSQKLSVLVSEGTAIPSVGSSGGHQILSNGTYGMMLGVNNSGNGWIQAARTDATATNYNLLLNPNGGNVGIGTTSPAAKLHVYSTAAFNRMQLENTGNFQNGIRLNRTGGDYATDWEIYTPSNSTSLNFFNGGNRMTMFANGRVGIGTTVDAGYLTDINGTLRTVNDAYFATTSGNVGIGTTSPASKLDINGNINTNSGIYFNSRLFAYTSGNYSILHDMNASSGTAHANIYMGNNDESNYYDNTAHRFRNRAGNSTRLEIFSNGNVGIGTGGIDTGYKLDVNGTTNTSDLRVVNSASIIGYNPLIFFNNGTQDIWSKGASGQIRIVDNAYSNVNFSLNQAGDGYFRGNVGIGTSTPNASSILDIASTTKGVLFPRMTTTEINAISSPADGLTVYNTTLKAICFYDASAAVWKKVSHSNM